MLVAAAFANAGDADKVARALSRYGLRALPAISGAQLLPPSIPMLMMAAGETSLPGVELLPRRSLRAPPAAEPRHEYRLHPAHRRPSGARRVTTAKRPLLLMGEAAVFCLMPAPTADRPSCTCRRNNCTWGSCKRTPSPDDTDRCRTADRALCRCQRSPSRSCCRSRPKPPFFMLNQIITPICANFKEVFCRMETNFSIIRLYDGGVNHE